MTPDVSFRNAIVGHSVKKKVLLYSRPSLKAAILVVRRHKSGALARTVIKEVQTKLRTSCRLRSLGRNFEQ